MNLDSLQIIYLIIILAISIWLHEYAHAITSYKLWDPTPKLQNRLTPNPLAHIDPIWFLMIFLIHFWRWKPVQIDPRYYKNPLSDELKVALVWPFTNIILAIFGMIIIFIYWKFWLLLKYPNEIMNIMEINYILYFWGLFSIINIWLAVFNMIPIPPLDWFRIVKFLFPEIWYQVEKNIWIPIIGLIIILMALWPVINYITHNVFEFLFWVLSQLFY
jgi:Zn-dependent protease